MCKLVVASQNGGVDKTTLAGHLAVIAEQNNYGSVALIDNDAQGLLSRWRNERKAETPLFANVDISQTYRNTCGN